MLWKPAEVDWLSLFRANEQRGIDKAIADLIESNPVIKGDVKQRPTEHNLEALKLYLDRVARSELMTTALREARPTSYLIQKRMVSGITLYLIRQHREHLLKRSNVKPRECLIEERQVWYPTRYYVMRGKVPFDWAKKGLLTEKEFYGLRPIHNGRRPVIITSIEPNGLFCVVPCSSSRQSSGVRGEFEQGRSSYAICKHENVMCWEMLCGEENEMSPNEIEIDDAVFSQIKQKVAYYRSKRLSEQVL